MIGEANRSRALGFTIIELTTVIVIVSILAVVAVAKLTSVDRYQVYGFFESGKAAARFAQKVAVAQRTNVVLVVTPTSINVCYASAACTTPVTDPATGQAMTVSAPDGISVTGPATILFDGLGRATTGGIITVNGAGMTHSLIVEQDTGYVHD